MGRDGTAVFLEFTSMKHVTIMAIHAVLCATAAGQCWDWQPPYTSPGVVGVSSTVCGFTMWDADGAGSGVPLLAVVGRFVRAGDVASDNVALWDGSRWSSPGGGVAFAASTTPSSINCCEAMDFDGEGPMGAWLVVGGQFSTPWGDGPLMAWDGVRWVGLPGVAPAAAFTQLVRVDADGAGPARLYAASGARVFEVDLSGGHELPGLSLGGYTAAGVFLAAWDPDGAGPLVRQLVVAVNETAPAQSSRVSIRAWAENAWSSPIASRFGLVSGFGVADFDGDGPHAEQFLLASNSLSSGPIFRRDGAQWVRLGTRQEAATALWVIDADEEGPAPARVFYLAAGGLREWLGSDWENMEASAQVQTMAAMDFDGVGGADPVLLAGGAMSRMPETTGPNVACIARSVGGGWRALGEGTDGLVNRVAAWDHDGDPLTPARVVVAGSFASMEGTATGPIAVFDGVAWTGASYGPTPASLAYTGPLCVVDRDESGPLHAGVYISARFSDIGGVALGNIARWDGAAFLPLGAGIGCTSGCGMAMRVFDPDGAGPLPAELVVGGFFSVDGVPGSANIARWDGTRWEALGAGLNGTVTSLVEWDPDGAGPQPTKLLASGAFSASGSVPLPGLAGWDGVAWTSLPAASHTINPITVWDADGDGPAPATLVMAQGAAVMRWTGSAWAAMGHTGAYSFASGGLASGGQVRVVQSVDPDGGGPRPPVLIAAGAFDRCGLWFMRNLAIWQYGEWRPLGGDAGTAITGLMSFDPDGPGPQAVRVMVESGDELSPRSFSVAGLAPRVREQPREVMCSLGEDVEFSLAMEDTAPVMLQWRKDGMPILDGTQVDGSEVSGAATPTLRVGRVVRSDSGSYACLTINACGSEMSEEAVLAVRCDADFDGSGGIDGGDVEAFFRAWEAGDSRADLNDNGGIDGQDVERFFLLWESGSC